LGAQFGSRIRRYAQLEATSISLGLRAVAATEGRLGGWTQSQKSTGVEITRPLASVDTEFAGSRM